MQLFGGLVIEPFITEVEHKAVGSPHVDQLLQQRFMVRQIGEFIVTQSGERTLQFVNRVIIVIVELGVRLDHICFFRIAEEHEYFFPVC